MVVVDSKGKPIMMGADFANYDPEKTFDGEEIPLVSKQIQMLKPGAKLDAINDFTDFPKSLKKLFFKVADARTKSGFKYKIPVAVKTIGAYGESAIGKTEIIPLDVLRIRMMVDPYNFSLRRWLSDMVFQDPTLSPGLQKRVKSFFADDFTLGLELKSMVNPQTGDPYLPEEAQAMLDVQKQQFLKYVMQLETWRKRPEIDILDKMKRSLISAIDQGRALNLIQPKPADLAPGALPISVRNITWENTGQVYVDSTFWQILGVRLFFINKDMATPDEMVYILGKNWGLRWLSDFYGASELEPFMQLSRINRKLLNYDIAKAIEAGYITKMILQADILGSPQSKQDQLGKLSQSFVAQNSDVMAVEYGVTVTPVEVKVDSAMLELNAKMVDDRLISAIGATRTQMQRLDGLNRDIATISEIENIRDVRTPDEMLIKTAFETQLFDPLLAHLAGVSVDELPVRVTINRIQPKDETIKTQFDQTKGPTQNMDQSQSENNFSQDKTNEIDSGDLKQGGDQNKTFGASRGPLGNLNVTLKRKEIAIANEKLRILKNVK